MNPKYEGLEVYDVNIHRNPMSKGFTIKWDAPKLGFGEITIWIGDDEKLHVDTECMSNEFVALVLSKIVPFLKIEG